MAVLNGRMFSFNLQAKVLEDLSIKLDHNKGAGVCKRVIGKFRLYVNKDWRGTELNHSSAYTVLNTNNMRVYTAHGTFTEIVKELETSQ